MSTSKGDCQRDPIDVDADSGSNGGNKDTKGVKRKAADSISNIEEGPAKSFKSKPNQAICEDKKTSCRQDGKKAHVQIRLPNPQAGNQCLRSECKVHKAKLREMEQKLQACQDQLWKAQPMPQISDDDVVARFNIVCTLVSDFLDAEARYRESLVEAGVLYDPYSIMENCSASLEGLAELGSTHQVPGDFLLLYAMFKLIQDRIFGSKILLVGVSDQFHRVLQAMHYSMRHLKPSRDPASVNSWRSETLTAIVHSKLFTSKQDRVKRSSANTFRSTLNGAFPELFKHEVCSNGLKNRVVGPAMEMAICLQTSVHQYRVQLPSLNDLIEAPFSQDNLTSFQFLKKETRKLVGGRGGIGKRLKDLHARPILAIEPALLRICRNGQNKVLRKGKILVQTDPDELHVKQAERTVSSHSNSNSTMPDTLAEQQNIKMASAKTVGAERASAAQDNLDSQRTNRSESTLSNMSSATFARLESKVREPKNASEAIVVAKIDKVIVQDDSDDQPAKQSQNTDSTLSSSDLASSQMIGQQPKKATMVEETEVKTADQTAEAVMGFKELATESVSQDQPHSVNKTKSSSNERTEVFLHLAPVCCLGNSIDDQTLGAVERPSQFQEDTAMTGIKKNLMRSASI